MRDIDGLADYAVSQSKNGKSISFEDVSQLNNDYIAKQAHGFAGVNTAIKEYNNLKKDSIDKANKFAETIGKSNANLGKYLTGLKNATGGMGGYAISLVGATVKTIALQVATTALNAALSMGISLLIQGVVQLGAWLWSFVPTAGNLAKKFEEATEELKEINSEIESLESELENVQNRINELEGKGTLSITEEAELQRLRLQNAELERQIELQKILQLEASKKQQKKFVNKYKNLDAEQTDEIVGFVSDEYIEEHGKEKASKKISEYSDMIKANQEDIQALYDAGYIYGTNEEVDARIDAMNRATDAYMYAMNKVGDTDVDWFSGIIARFPSAKTALEELAKSGEITAEKLKNALNGEHGEELKNLLTYLSNIGAIDLKGILGDDRFGNLDTNLDGYIDTTEAAKMSTEDFIKLMPSIVAEFNKTGDAAETAGGNVDKMTVSLDNLKDASESIAIIQKAFDEMSEDGYVTTETLSKIKEAVGDNISNWDEYQQKLLSVKKGSTEFKQILSDLTYAIIENKFETKGLENATKEEVAAILRENGVLNANEVAHDMVTRAKIEAKGEALAFAIANGQATESLYSELEALGLTKTAITELAEAYRIAQEKMTTLTESGVLRRLGLQLAELKGITTMSGVTSLVAEKMQLDDNWEESPFASSIAQEYGKNAGLIWSYVNAQNEIEKLLSDITNGVTVRYSGSKSSDKDKPDKADQTDAIINRIASNVEALERQGKIIDNQLDMVDAEKEYDKYIELTNKALDNRLKTIEASKTAQNELSKEAQKIRDKYKGIDVESFFYANGGFTEAYDKYYESFGSKTKREAFADDMKMIQEFKKAWFEYYDDIMGLEKEVFDLRKDLQEAHYDHLSDLINQLERHADLREKQAEDDKEHYDYLIDKEQALLDMKKAQFGIENKLLSARREAEKALATSKIGSEYLDEETRKLVYNDDDYKLEIDKINEISDYVNDLTEDYISDLNRLGEEEIYKAEEITAQYERRIALKEKELEIVQAEIDLQKKQDIFNNVLAEKNIRQIVDGKWVWTHDTDKLRQANEDLEDAKAQVEQLEREKEQLKYTNSLEARIGQWELEQEAIDVAMKNLQDKIDEFSTKVELLKDPLQDFGAIVRELTAELGNINIESYTSGGSSSGSSGSLGGSKYKSYQPSNTVEDQLRRNSEGWWALKPAADAGDPWAKQMQEEYHAKNEDIRRENNLDSNNKPLFDSGGVLKGLGGIKATEKDEIVLSPSLTEKILTPENNIMFDRFTDNLETIFDFSKFPIQQIPFNVPKPNMSLLDTATNRNTVVNYNMNGDVNINEAEDGNRLLQSLTNKIKSMPIPN